MNNLKKSPEEIQVLQWKKFQKIIREAYANVPFYQEKFKQAGISPEDIKTRANIEKIPVTTKEELIKAGDKCLSKKFIKQNLNTSKTSGSTGQPFTTYFDKRAWARLKFASKLRSKKICGLKWGARIINIEEYTPDEAKLHNHSNWIKDLVLKMRYLSIHDDFKKQIDFFQSFKPDALYGLPSYFIELADYIKNNKIDWQAPKIIFTSGELFNNSAKRKLEQDLNTRIYDIYGSTELKEVAFECGEKKGYHINEDLYLVEIINDGQAEDGKVVVTSLEQRAMPLIRFSVADRAEIVKEKCFCNLPFGLMSPSYGREVDYLILSSGKRVSPYVLTMAMEKVENILQYQITQKDLHNITVNVRTNQDKKMMVESIRQALKAVLDEEVSIDVVISSVIPTEVNGKYRVVKSLL